MSSKCWLSSLTFDFIPCLNTVKGSYSLRSFVCVSCSYIGEEPPSTLAAAVLGLGYLAPDGVVLLLAPHHPLPASSQPCWFPQELRAVIWPVQPAEQPGQTFFVFSFSPVFSKGCKPDLQPEVVGLFGTTFTVSSRSLLYYWAPFPSDRLKMRTNVWITAFVCLYFSITASLVLFASGKIIFSCSKYLYITNLKLHFLYT